MLPVGRGRESDLDRERDRNRERDGKRYRDRQRNGERDREEDGDRGCYQQMETLAAKARCTHGYCSVQHRVLSYPALSYFILYYRILPNLALSYTVTRGSETRQDMT